MKLLRKLHPTNVLKRHVCLESDAIFLICSFFSPTSKPLNLLILITWMWQAPLPSYNDMIREQQSQIQDKLKVSRALVHHKLKTSGSVERKFPCTHPWGYSPFDIFLSLLLVLTVFCLHTALADGYVLVKQVASSVSCLQVVFHWRCVHDYRQLVQSCNTRLLRVLFR